MPEPDELDGQLQSVLVGRQLLACTQGTNTAMASGTNEHSQVQDSRAHATEQRQEVAAGL